MKIEDLIADAAEAVEMGLVDELGVLPACEDCGEPLESNCNRELHCPLCQPCLGCCGA